MYRDDSNVPENGQVVFSGSYAREDRCCSAKKDMLLSSVVSRAMFLIAVETTCPHCLSVRSPAAFQGRKAIHRYFNSSWFCTPGNRSRHYALCLTVGLVEGRDHDSRYDVVACAVFEVGIRKGL